MQETIDRMKCICPEIAGGNPRLTFAIELLEEDLADPERASYIEKYLADLGTSHPKRLFVNAYMMGVLATIRSKVQVVRTN